MRIVPALLALGLCLATPLSAWGRHGHRIVAALALQDLPPGPAAWFQGLEATVEDHSSDPDEWKQDRAEGPRHYLEMDTYDGDLPASEDEARARLGKALFRKSGQLPWVIQDRVRILTEAFQSGDRARVALEASYLSHYVGDLHVPLHTVTNYDGQKTGQKGVHARWETGLVDRLAVPAEPRPAALEPDLPLAPWRWLRETYPLAEQVLADDRAAGDGHGAAYWQAFAHAQEATVRNQLARAGQRTAQLILWAWTRAGRPAAPGHEPSRP